MGQGEKDKQEINKLYRELITELKILYMRTDHNGEKSEAERYRKAYQRLELIQERRHLTPIGEQGKDKEVYQLTVAMLGEKYQNNGKTKEAIEDTIVGIESLCEEFDIQDKEENGEKVKDNGLEKE